MQTWPDVLIVDDEKNIRFFAAEIFRMEGISAATASDGCQALEYFEKALGNGGRLPRVVILDMMMPCMNGLQVIDTIAQQPWSKDMKIIMTSGAREDYTYAGKRRDIYVMAKPYEVTALLDLIREIVPDLFG